MESRLLELEAALLAIDRVGAATLLEEAGVAEDPLAVFERLVVPALLSIGEAWERGDAALAQVYMSGLICEDLVERFVPPLPAAPAAGPRVALAVLHDHHHLGRRIVHSVLRAGGVPVLDYGRVEVDDVIERVQRDGVQVLLLSALMLPSALKVAEVVRRLPPGVKLGVGGAPFRLDPGLAERVGAHAWGRSAADALSMVRELLGSGSGTGSGS